MMENKCFLLSLEYYYKTELFDRSVCTGRDKYGVAIPRNSIEKIKIEENAKNLYSKLLAGLKDDGEFKSYFLNMKFERLERIWKTHEEEIKMILINRKIVFSNLSKSKILDENIDIVELTNYVYKNIIKMNEKKSYSLTEAEKSFYLIFDYPNIYIDKLIHNFKKYKNKEV